jgi:hypothetical protein
MLYNALSTTKFKGRFLTLGINSSEMHVWRLQLLADTGTILNDTSNLSYTGTHFDALKFCILISGLRLCLSDKVHLRGFSQKYSTIFRSTELSI